MNERDNLKKKINSGMLLIFWYFGICDIFGNDIYLSNVWNFILFVYILTLRVNIIPADTMRMYFLIKKKIMKKLQISLYCI